MHERADFAGQRFLVKIYSKVETKKEIHTIGSNASVREGDQPHQGEYEFRPPKLY